MDPGVDVLAPRLARGDELGEAAVAAAQVRLGGHQIGLGDAHRGLDAALGLRIERLARMHRRAVMPPGRDHRRVPHRDPGDVLHRDRLRVVSQQIRRHPTDPAQGGVQARDQRAHRLVPDRDHHPEPRPGQPRAEQIRLAPVDPRARRPSRTATTAPARPPTAGTCAAARPATPASPPAPPDESCVRCPQTPSPVRRSCTLSARIFPFDASTSSSTFARNASISFGRDRRRPDQRIPAAGLPQRHIPLHRLRITPGQLRRRMRAAGQVVRLQDFHDLPVRLGHGLSGQVGGKVSNPQPTSRRDPLHVAATEIT